MKISFGRPVLLGFIATILVVAVLGVVSFSSMARLITTSRLLSHGLQVISNADLALKAIVDAQSSVRGFIITGEEDFLAYYTNAKEPIGKYLRRLDSLTVNDSIQRIRVDTIRRLLEEQLAHSERVVALRRSSFEEAKNIILTRIGKNRMDSIRNLVKRLQQEEGRTFRRGNTITGNSLRQFQIYFVSLCLSITTIILILFYAVNRTLNQRKKAEAELRISVDQIRNLNASLEAKVQERTRELSVLNNTLERRVAERTEELNKANKTLESFTYSVSHDLRAPLRSITGFANIVMEDHGSRLPSEGRDALNVIISNGKRMGQLIDDLLDFSRVGRKELTSERINMTDLAGEAAAEVSMQYPGRKVNMRISALPDAQGDSSLIRQVWINLLSNAFKYSGKKVGDVIIEIGSYRDNGQLVYFVSDNGAGFDMKYVDKLFGVFQRLHKASEFEGTGVGLALVKTIVERHGGHTWAEGKVNEGAKFYFTLPANINAS
jgi:signal transduction histidine kinase